MKKTAVLFFILIIGYVLGGLFPYDTYFLVQPSVTLKADVELPRESGFKESAVIGTLKAGTQCVQLYKKGALSYLNCSVVLPNKFIQ